MPFEWELFQPGGDGERSGERPGERPGEGERGCESDLEEHGERDCDTVKSANSVRQFLTQY